MTAGTGAYVADSERERVPAPRSESRARSQLIGVRLTPDEHATLLRLAALHQMSPAAVLRAGLTLFSLTELTHE